MEKELPKNWVLEKLGNLLIIERGGSPRPIEKYITESDDGLNWIKISDATASGKYIYSTKQKITKDGLIKTRYVKPGDFILSNSMSFGRPYIMKTDGCIHDGWLALKDSKIKIFESEYLYYLLSSSFVFNQFDSLASGSTVRNLNKDLVASVNVKIPPLTEQNRIVAKLDSLFAQLESIKTSMAKIPVLLKNFRQQVLTQAVTGKLTEEWREGKEFSSEQLFRCIQEKRKILINKRDDKNDVFLNNQFIDIPNNWILVNLWDLAFLVTSGSRDWSKYYSDEGAYFVRSAEINNNKLRLKEAIKVNLPEKIEGKRSLIEKGNILITITGANVGKCALIEESIPESYVSQSVALVKVVDAKISKFIHLSLLSRSDDGSQLENLAYGMGRPVLSLPQIKSVKIPLPSLDEQLEIVNRVESLFAKVDAIEEKYKNLKAKIEILPQTILHKAFKGELTEQLETDGDARDLLDEIAALKNEGKTKNKVIKSTNTIRNKADEN